MLESILLPVRHLRASIWSGSTTEVEIVLALDLGLRAVWMLWPTWQSIPIEVQGYLIPPGMPETQYGLVLLSCSVAQLAAAVHRAPLSRALIATLIALFQGSIAFAYWQSGLFFRGVVPLILSITLVEWWVSWRAWSDRLSRPTYERRGNSHE